MADFEDREAMVDLRAELEASPAYNAYWRISFTAGTVLGLILLAVALLRRRIVPVWSPALLVAASALWLVGGGERLLGALSLLTLAATLAPLAARIWSLSGEDWERWEIPLSKPAESLSADRSVS